MSTEQAKHTPGPWVTGRDDMQSYHGLTGQPFSSVYRDADDARCPMTPDGFGGTTRVRLRIATIEGEYIERDEEKANARLIAAAPDMDLVIQSIGAVAKIEGGEFCFNSLRYSFGDRDCVRLMDVVGRDALRAAIARAKGGAA